MSRKILITYASRAGSTEQTAAYMGQTLRDKGFTVDVKPIKENPDPSPYAAVLCGSAIRGGAWLPEAVDYVRDHHDVLAERFFVAWTMCLTLADDTPEHREQVSDYLAPIREIVQPEAEGFFAGVMDLSKLSFPVRLLIKAMKAPSGDFRDWDAIRNWLDELTPLLEEETEATR